MDSQRDELELHVPLILTVGVWLLALGSLFVAAVMLASPVHMLVGGSGEFTILGVRWPGETGAWSIAGDVGIGLAMLGYAVHLVYVSGFTRDDPEPQAPAQPRVLWPPTPAPAGGLDVRQDLLRIDGDAYAVSFTPEGVLVTVGAGGMRLWDVASGRELLHVPEANRDVALSPVGGHVAFTRGSFGIVIRSLHDGDERTLVHHSSFWKSGAGTVSAIAFSADGRRLATGGDPDTRVWSVADGSELLRIPTGQTEFYGLSIAFSPDGHRLATTTTDRVVDVWDAASGSKVQRLDHRPHTYGRVATGLAFSPDSRMLATLCADHSAWIWEIDGGGLVLELPGPGRQPPYFHPRRLAWSPDGRRLIVPGCDGNVRAWDSASGAELLCLDHGDPPQRSPWAQWSGADRILGVSSGVTAVAVSRDGTMLATGDANGVVRVRALP
jgi:WD40 repeat protein